MIKMLRIDDRLLHGQVVFMWTKQLNIKGIIVANDELVTDPIQSLAMKLAVPEHLKLLIKTIDEAAKLINDPRAAGMNILVVYNISLMNWRCQILLFMPGMPEGMEKVRGRVVIAHLLRVQCGMSMNLSVLLPATARLDWKRW